MVRGWFGFLAGVVVFSLLSCSVEKAEKSDPSTASEDVGKKAMETSPLSLELSTTWEDGSTSIVQDRCYIDPAESVPATKTCTITVPELILHYSTVNFKIGTDNASRCAQISFHPYYYLRSASAAYLPAGDTTEIDCSAGALAKCWGGAAPALLGTDFPAVVGRYFLPGLTTTATFTVPSSNSRGQKDSDRSFRTNVNICNSLPESERNRANGTVEYAGNGAYYDYRVECRDPWGEVQYSLKVILRDDDSTTGGSSDTFYDWGQ